VSRWLTDFFHILIAADQGAAANHRYRHFVPANITPVLLANFLDRHDVASITWLASSATAPVMARYPSAGFEPVTYTPKLKHFTPCRVKVTMP
jgi:hypothetical protein